jgi:hypothetical protein
MVTLIVVGTPANLEGATEVKAGKAKKVLVVLFHELNKTLASRQLPSTSPPRPSGAPGVMR